MLKMAFGDVNLVSEKGKILPIVQSIVWPQRRDEAFDYRNTSFCALDEVIFCALALEGMKGHEISLTHL